MINRQIGAKTPARELCSALSGRVMALRVNNTALAVYLIAEDEQLLVSTEYADDPDVVVCGSLLSLTRLSGPGGDATIRDGEVELSGDALLARQFQKLLQYGRPDVEEELSAIVGDVAAHGIGEIVRSAGAWGREARATMRQNIGEYLQEESRAVPTREEVEIFRSQVDGLRDDVARFEARLTAIELQSATQDNV
jgi:ubiquinone biosynthesis protein UbiJ